MKRSETHLPTEPRRSAMCFWRKGKLARKCKKTGNVREMVGNTVETKYL